MRDSAVIEAKVDSWVDQAAPAKRHGGESRLGLEDAGGTPQAYAYIYFNLPFRRGQNILSAILRVRTRGDWNASKTLTVRRITEDWKASKITFNNRPNVSDQNVTLTQSSVGDNDIWEINVESLIQSAANGAKWFGLRIGTTSAARIYLQSAQAAQGNIGPELEIEWSDAPQQPTDLVPAGGQVVSVAKPIVSCDFTDNRGSQEMQAIQVQVDDVGSPWSSPDYDSGEVPATEPELDLSRTDLPGGVFTAPTEGSTVHWRVRVQDASNEWSEWSTGTTWVRGAKDALTITAPAAEPNNYVTEWTPPIAWSFAGTQEAWAVAILDALDPTEELWNSGRTSGTDNSVNIPKDVIVDDNDYIVRVRVWDDEERAATPGDPPWIHATRTFHFDEDLAETQPTDFSVELIDPTPYVLLQWDRATMPDRFVIERNGNVVKEIDDPADALVSGTTYQTIDREANPRREHTWKVRSIVNGVTSQGPTASLTVTCEGLWLTDDERDLDVLLTDVDMQLEQLEVSTTHLPLNASRPVKIVQSMGAYTGNVTATLARIPELNRSYATQRDRLYSIKERPLRPVQFIVGDLSFKAILSNISHTPVDNPDNVEGRQASVVFDVAQTSKPFWNARF